MITFKFHTRVLLMLGALAVLVLVPVFLTVVAAIRTGVIEHANAELETGARVFSQLMQDRDEDLLRAVRVLAGDFGFKRAVATGDIPTIHSVLENHGGVSALATRWSCRLKAISQPQPPACPTRASMCCCGS